MRGWGGGCCVGRGNGLSCRWIHLIARSDVMSLRRLMHIRIVKSRAVVELTTDRIFKQDYLLAAESLEVDLGGDRFEAIVAIIEKARGDCYLKN